MKYMLEDLRAQQPKGFFSKEILYADAVTILVGGTDTIASVLSFSFVGIFLRFLLAYNRPSISLDTSTKNQG